MEEKPLFMTTTISVVVPFSRGEFIHETMASVLAQTYAPIEIIIIDDGAPELDAKELRRYEDRVRLVHQPNRGPAAARNAGVALASGEWIAFLDDDDTWDNTRLARLSEYIENHPNCDVVHNAVRIMGTGQIQRKSPLDVREFLLIYPSPAKSSSVMLRRSTLLRCGMMNPALPLCEDYECFLRVAVTNRFHYVDAPLTSRRKHEASLSSNFVLKYRIRNRLLFLYQDLYPSDADRTLFATRMNARFLGQAWQRRDWKAIREIIALASLHGVSKVALFDAALEDFKRHKKALDRSTPSPG